MVGLVGLTVGGGCGCGFGQVTHELYAHEFGHSFGFFRGALDSISGGGAVEIAHVVIALFGHFYVLGAAVSSCPWQKLIDRPAKG